MKNKYNALANLYDLIQSAEKELGLKGITENDNVKITYKQIKENLSTKDNNISRAQFFKSLSTLINKKIISKIGLERSSSFKFLNKKLIN